MRRGIRKTNDGLISHLSIRYFELSRKSEFRVLSFGVLSFAFSAEPALISLSRSLVRVLSRTSAVISLSHSQSKEEILICALSRRWISLSLVHVIGVEGDLRFTSSTRAVQLQCGWWNSICLCRTNGISTL